MAEGKDKDKVVVNIPRRFDSVLGSGVAKALEGAAAVISTLDSPEADASKEVEMGEVGLLRISPALIAMSPYQAREIPSNEELEGLAKSIESKGIIQPIIVRPQTKDAQGRVYELIAGERRLRAAMLAGLAVVPAIVQNLSDREAVELSVIENAQRENLNPVEEAQAYRCLIKDFKLSQAEVAQVVGKNRATIANAVRLLQLDSRVLEMLKQGVLSSGHGRALLMLQAEDDQYRLATHAVRWELSVRALESLVDRALEKSEQEEEVDEELEKEKAALERQRNRISESLGVERVSLRIDPKGHRCLNLTFDTEASWKRFLGKLRSS